MKILALIFGIGVVAGAFADSATDSFYTGVFRGAMSTGVISSWSFEPSGTMTGTWLTNNSAMSVGVTGRYKRDRDALSFLIEGTVSLPIGDPIKVKIVGTGKLSSAGGEGTFTLFSEDSRLATDSGTWTVVSGYANLQLQRPAPPPVVPRPSDANLVKKATALEIRNAFLPGLSASLLVPFKAGTVFEGAHIHYAFIQGISSSTSASAFGGYYEWYSEIGYYKELGSNPYDDIFFTYSTGVNLSFEKFLSNYRAVLVPYFGAKFGGIFFNKASGGLYLEPVLGIVVVQTPSLNINYDAGLFLNTVNLSDNIGVHHSLVMNFNL